MWLFPSVRVCKNVKLNREPCLASEKGTCKKPGVRGNTYVHVYVERWLVGNIRRPPS